MGNQISPLLYIQLSFETIPSSCLYLSQTGDTNLKSKTLHQIGIPMTKPFLKWVGGKSQLLTDVFQLFPSSMTNYHEPFLGGGSVLLGFLSQVREGKRNISGTVYASDLNPHLISLYRHIQINPEEFLQEIHRLVTEFESINGLVIHRKPTTIEEAKTSQESYYYWTRQQFNNLQDTTSIKKAAMFLFLNKTCFRGVYREGPHGFNVPFGHYKKPGIVDDTHIREVSALLQGVIFTCQGFEESFQKVRAGDFIYLDPPYAPETDTSFVGYTAEGFGVEQHKTLFTLCGELKQKNVQMLMSNADVALVRQAFPEATYSTTIISARRAIHSKDPSSKTNEVLIRNV